MNKTENTKNKESDIEKLLQEKPTITKTPADFKVGEVYKMNVASRSHVKNPYYVVISEVGDTYIVTDIPQSNSCPHGHSLKIYPENNWNYHIPRMEFMGMDMSLVTNQELI